MNTLEYNRSLLQKLSLQQLFALPTALVPRQKAR